MSHISHLLSFNFMLVTSWCLTLWCSLQTSPYSFSLFALQKERLNAIYKRQWPQLLRLPAGPVAGLPDASLLTVLKQCKKKEYRILICLLFISNLWWWAPTVWSPWFPIRGDTVLETQVYCVLSSSSLGIKVICCRGPAPADPGSSKRGQRRRGSGYNSFN